jgi:hypothetical protein
MLIAEQIWSPGKKVIGPLLPYATRCLACAIWPPTTSISLPLHLLKLTSTTFRDGTRSEMSPSPSPLPLVAPVGAAKAEPDLFFPASDSEDEHDKEDGDEGEILASVPSSTVRDAPSSSTARGELGSSSAAQAQPQPQTSFDSTLVAPSDEPIPFFASQDSDILPVSPVCPKPKPRPRPRPSPSHSSRSSPAPSALEVPSAGPSRKRSSPAPPARSPSVSIPEGFTGGYLGEFVCEGWSLSKGKGYCSPGSKIVFERPKPPKTVEDEARSLARSKEKVGPARLVNGKVVHAKGKPVAGKQMTLGAMGMSKKAPPPVSAILRLTGNAVKVEGHLVDIRSLSRRVR